MSVNLGSLMAAARRRFVACAFVSLAALSVPAAHAQDVINTVSVAPPVGIADPVGGCTGSPPVCTGNNTATDSDSIESPQLTLTKTHSGDFTVGVNGLYTLTLSNTSASAPTSGTITVADSLPAGLNYVSATGSGWTCGAAGQVVTCTTTAVIAAGASAPAITLTVAVDAAAAPSVTNTARASGGGDTTCPASGATQARCNPSDPTTVSSVPVINFCAANTVYNITQSTSGATRVGNFYRFDLSGTDTEVLGLALPVAPADTNFNALMIDPVRNRLLVISYSGDDAQLWAYDAANGGWYKAAPLMTGVFDLPRAGMSPSGVGYLMAGNDDTPEVWSVTASGAFDYTIVRLGELSFNLPPTGISSGDMAFDAAGNGWMSIGQDIYKINFSTLDAVRQQRPLLNGSPSPIGWAGVAFGSDDRLYLATNNSANTYYALDFATGALTLVGSNVVSQARDLASCAFPAEPQPAQLQVEKRLGLINGVPAAAGATVKPGDVLTYHIDIEHVGGDMAATLFPGDVVDSPLPANTTYVAAGNDFTCAGASCTNTNTVNIAAGTSQTLNFVTQVDNPLPPNLASITNAVTVKGVNCAAAGNDCTETTTVAPAVTVAKSSNPASGTTVAPGDAIQYTLTVTVANSATTGAVTLTDTLSEGQTAGAMPAGCTILGQVVTCVLAAGSAPGAHTFVYPVTVNADASGTIGNNVMPSGPDNPTCAASGCTTEHPIAASTVTVAKSSTPASGTAVLPGATINYTLTVTVAGSLTAGVVTLTDTLSAGQTLGALPAGCTPSGQVITCTLAAGTLPGVYTFAYPATVNADATGTIGNNVVPSGTDDPSCAPGACATTHPITPPSVTVAKSANPASGVTVNPGDAISYTLTVTVANSATTGAVTLTDTLSAGQTPGAMPAGCLVSGQVVTCTLAAGTLPGTYTFVYPATVNTDATGTIGNNVVPSGIDNPACAPGACTTTHPIVGSAVVVSKTSNPASGATVAPGDTIDYTLTVTVANSATTDAVTLSDTLSAGQTLTGALPAGCTPSGQVVTCVLAAGALPSGSPYTFVYRATVNATATGSIGNNVVPSGGDDPVCAAGGCTTTHPIVPAVVTVSKASNPASGTTVDPGDTIQYTLTVNVANSATTGAVTLTDTLSAGQTLGVLPAGCTPSGQVVTCTLAAGTLPGTYTFAYPTTVNADATGTIGNNVVPSGTDDPSCAPGACATTHPIVASAVTVSKSSLPASGAMVNPGDTIQYTLTVNVANSATTGAVTLTDTLSAGQTLSGALPAGCAPSGQVVTCTLAPGALPGPYTFVYSATVNANATGTIGNNVVPSGPDDPACAPSGCATTHSIVPTAVTVSKSANPASGTTVNPGDTINYTLTVNVANSATTAPVTLTDTLSAGQTLGAMPAGCIAAGQVATCVLGAGALPGNYTFTYPATVDANATGTIGNNVVPSGPDNPSCVAGGCTTEHPIIATAVTVSKSSNPASGATVNPGDAIQYTLTVNVANSATTGAVTLTDTLSAGQTLGAMPAGCTASGQVVTCTMAAGALPGGSPYTFVYIATVDANATGSIGNNVVPSGTDNPTCAAGGCSTTHSIVAPSVTVAKSSDPASGTAVNANATVTYTVTVTVANSATISPVVLTDTLSGQQSLTGTPTVPAGGNCTVAGNGLTCTLAAGALPGTYAFVYQTVVAAAASGSIGNVVAATGGGPNDPICTNCSTTHPIAEPVVEVSKTSAPGNGVTVNVGDTIDYTLTVAVANAATTQPVVLTDTPGTGLTVGALPSGCAMNGASIVCTLPAGSVPGTYAFAYPATVNADANGNVSNAVAATGGTASGQPNCVSCGTAHPVVDAAQLRIVKQASPRDVKIGDLVRYTLTIENVGVANVVDATLVDTPPAGFSYVADSLSVADADGAGRLVGTYPIRVDRLDVRVGEHATVQYLLRVGAGVRPGAHVNRAHAEDGGQTISNEASAEVQLIADPLLDESLLIGTVFDDRDGDGWQDRAGLSGVRAQGGFAPGAYVAGSTTVDRGTGPAAQADASAPLLHGIDIGEIAGRQSDAEPLDAHTVVISQTLNALVFSDDFALTSKQGVTVRMDAAGNTRSERSGDAAKGLSGADPKVERRVSQVGDGYRVDYIIRNAGVDERGIPGVRIASVEGLLIETDQFGRYHLEGVAGGPWERGRNFILKVDPATLPPGSVFTSDNPLVRRITPGLPVRFDFGVKLPFGLVDGGKQTVEMELGAVMFDADSARLRAEYAPVIDKIVEQVRTHGGGEVLIAANGETQALAYDRAKAVRDALLEKLSPEQAKALTIDLRADLDDPSSSLVAVGESPVLGTVLFDTDQARIKPEYAPLIEKIADDIERMKGGTVGVIGHADKRGGDAYNVALGLRRAKTVYEAIAAKLSPEVRAKLRVDISDNPTAPVGIRGR